MKKVFLSTFHDINSFSLPLILNSIFNLLISIVLTSIIGRISVGAIVSTEIIDTLNYAILGIAGVGTLVFNIESSKVRLVNEKDFFDWFKSCYLINGSIGLIIITAIFLFAKDVFYFIYEIKNQELDIICKYAYIASFSIFANMLIFSLSNLLKVNKKTKYILFAGITGSILQLALAYFMVNKVLEGNYKLLGVSISSTFTVFLQLIIYLYILRKEIQTTFSIKSSRKKELILKSIPLMLQEVLEGSVFSVLIITLIARLGENIISSYSISMRIVSLCLLPMYMYCNSLTVLVGEYQSKKEYLKMKILPITTIVTTISVYVIISVLSYIYKENLIGTLTNINSVQEGTLQMLKTVLLFSVFQILFENSKYVLQSIGKSKEALKTTVVINSLASIILIEVNIYNLLDLKIVLGILALNYLILSVFFLGEYLKEVKEYSVL